MTAGATTIHIHLAKGSTMKLSKTVFIICTLGFAATGSATSTGSLQPTQDAMIFATSGGTDTGNASGKGPGMFAGADGSSNKKRALILFNLSSISTGATVDTVTLSLVVGQVAGSGGGGGMGGGCGMGCTYPTRHIRLFKLNSSHGLWNEGNTQSPTSMTIGGTGQGASYTTCNCNDVTWTHTNYHSPGAVSWTNLGTDFDTPDVYDNAITSFAVGTTNTFFGDKPNSVQLSFVATVQDWVTNPSHNQGFLIKSDLETSPTSFIGWWTKDGAAANSNSALSPTIVVTYH